jgi:membrane protease YdiL (CAAX protease family)
VEELEGLVEEWALNALVVLFYLPVILGSLLYLEYTGGTFALWVRTLGEQPARDVAIGVAVGGGLVLLSLAIGRTGPGRRMVDGLRRAIGPASAPAILVLAASSALGEELLFRAVLQPRVGWVPAAALFALAHLPWSRAMWLWTALAFPTGLLFGGLYEWTGAALAPIVAHAVVNAANLWWIGRAAPLSPEGASTGSATSSPADP